MLDINYWHNRKIAIDTLMLKAESGLGIDRSPLKFQIRSTALQIIHTGRALGMMETVRFHEIYLDSYQ